MSVVNPAGEVLSAVVSSPKLDGVKATVSGMVDVAQQKMLEVKVAFDMIRHEPPMQDEVNAITKDDPAGKHRLVLDAATPSEASPLPTREELTSGLAAPDAKVAAPDAEVAAPDTDVAAVLYHDGAHQPPKLPKDVEVAGAATTSEGTAPKGRHHKPQPGQTQADGNTIG